MSRQTALLISRNLPPMRGGIERLMAHAVEALMADYDCDVIGPRGCARALPGARRVRELPPASPLFLAGALTQVAAWRRERFALCVAANGLVAPVAAAAARLSGAPWLSFVHGLDLVAAHPFYQVGFVPILRRADAIITNSAATRALALARGVPERRIHIVHPGVAAVAPAGGDFRRRHRIGPGPFLLSAGRLVPRKGIAGFVEHALPQVLARHPEARYIVAGDEPRHALLRAPGTRDAIAAAARRAGVAASVQFLGAIEDDELAAAYAAADAFVFPVEDRPGDVEGFGLVILEAAAHGIPTIAFAAGGVPDAMSPDNGLLVPPGDPAAFARAVCAVLDGTAGVTAERCRRHAARFGWPAFGERVRAVARGVARAA